MRDKAQHFKIAAKFSIILAQFFIYYSGLEIKVMVGRGRARILTALFTLREAGHMDLK